MTDCYVEYPPPVALRPHVECFWLRTPSLNAPAVTRVLPDGCVDIVLVIDGALSAAHAVGTMTRPLLVLGSQYPSVVGVRFRPGRARMIFGLPASELTNLWVSLEEVWPDATSLIDRLARLTGALAAVVALQRALEERLSSASGVPPQVTAAIERIASAQGHLRIGSLGPALGITRQSLARQFAEHVGVSPKMLSRVVRLRSLLAHVRGADSVPWSSLALRHGFYDQSHLIEDFRELTGLPPDGWLRGG
jgi:AraC-like DNA-binding protein